MKESKPARTKTPQRSPNEKEPGDEVHEAKFPIVGIGASAGGLKAFKQLFSAMPTDSGMAFVLIPHLDPTHDSLMGELLSKQTTMPVREAEDGTIVEANSVYVIPPNKDLAIAGGALYLSPPPQPRGLQTAIDFFLRSLATDQGERAIGIVLSGTGNHGALGIKEIKLAGGMVIAQEPESADYDQMPRSAIATDVVDYVLPPEEMPAALIAYVEHPYLNGNGDGGPRPEEATKHLNRILAALLTRTKHDFRCYRKKMLLRRVERRMGVCHIDDFAKYLDVLRENDDEVEALKKDLLIGVTCFFREAEAFALLEQQVIPELVARATDGRPVRVWVPGCSTGEEAYSIAMLLIEGFAVADKPLHLQIFASDIDEESLAVARNGVYPDSIVGDVSHTRLKRFFVKTDDTHYQVTKQLRESIVFAPQNLISDPPFSKLDLIGCRNLLIYLEPEIQKKVIALFHFALVEEGRLFLGPSESIGRAVDLFEPVSKKWRIYRRIGPVRRELFAIPIVSAGNRQDLPQADPSSAPPVGVKELTEKLIIADYAPASALINRKYEVLYMTGPLVDYLEFPVGEPTRDLLAMARHGLRTKIRAGCHKAMRDVTTVTDADARVQRNGVYMPCSITVRPITEEKDSAGLMLVTFRDRQAVSASTGGESAAPEPAEESRLVQQLEYELKSTSEDLQSTVEEMQSSNEELKASNEEVMSMNEELQSTNEELETSKEELQSLNEELSTVNNQLQDKIEELDKSHNDLTNLMASTEIATVFLDSDLCIKLFTPPTGQLLNLLATDVGRPLRDFAPRFTDDTMLKECRQVLEQLTPVETEICTEGDCYFLRRILPYRTADNRIEGVVVTFVDITKQKLAEAERLAREFFEGIVDTVHTPLLVLNSDLAVINCNTAFLDTFHVTEDQAVGRLIFDLGNRQWNMPELRQLLGELLPLHRNVTDVEVKQEFENIGRRTMLLNARAISHAGKHTDEILLSIDDITSKQLDAERLRHAERMTSIGMLVIGMAHEIKNPLAAVLTAAQAALNLKDQFGAEQKLENSLHTVVSSAMRCNEIVTGLRKFAAMDSTEKKLDNLNDIIQRAASSTREYCESHGALIEILAQPDIPYLTVNSREIELMLKNLIVNSVQAGTGDNMITIRTERRRDIVRIIVQDKGFGISIEAKQHAFEPFYSTRHDDGGMGLGLSIVYGIVADHSGSIRIDNHPDGGAVVTVDVPIK